MSAEVETMFYTREKPWHGLGTRVEEAPTSLDAMRLAGLNWDVEAKPISLQGESDAIPNVFANVRTSDNAVLGIVSDRYRIVQNVEAFAFTDTLIGGDVHYETAGSLNGGRRVWLLAKMPEQKILDDDVSPYLCFSNTHDGTGAVKVCMTPVRVVCNNTLNFAISKAKRSWSVKHTGDISMKIKEAQDTLELAKRYMLALNEYAEKLTEIRIDEEALAIALGKVFPKKENASPREQAVEKKKHDDYMVCYFAPDIAKFRGTAWGALNAMTDMVAHMEPARVTKNYQENNMKRIIDGHTLVDEFASVLVGSKA